MAGARAICSATISFGLVSIPIKAYITASPEKFSFKMLTKSGNRVNRVYKDSITREEVKESDCDAGYELEKDKFVVFTDAEIESLNGVKNNYIEIEKVIPASDVNLAPTHVEKALYMVPDKSNKAYNLLVKALKMANKVAICRWTTRGKTNLVALAPVGKVLMMFQLYYVTELRTIDEGFTNDQPSEKEVALATQLLEQLNGNFKLSDYKDEYIERVKEAIVKKQEGKSLLAALEAPKESKVFDLAALLESSLNKDKVAV